ncbi:hypothetical protein ACWG8W_06350 [Citricoccus zhacaiensis]
MGNKGFTVLLTKDQARVIRASAYGKPDGAEKLAHDIIAGNVRTFKASDSGLHDQRFHVTIPGDLWASIVELVPNNVRGRSAWVRGLLFGTESLRTTEPGTDYGVLLVNLTKAQKKAFANSGYGHGAGAHRLVADIKAGTVQRLTAPAPQSTGVLVRHYLLLSHKERAEVHAYFREQGVPSTSGLRTLLFGTDGVELRVDRRTLDIALTESQRAAYEASKYGSLGGSKLLLRDLFAGTVQTLDADNTGPRTRLSISLDARTKERVDLRAGKKGLSNARYVRRALVGR